MAVADNMLMFDPITEIGRASRPPCYVPDARQPFSRLPREEILGLPQLLERLGDVVHLARQSADLLQPRLLLAGDQRPVPPRGPGA